MPPGSSLTLELRGDHNFLSGDSLKDPDRSAQAAETTKLLRHGPTMGFHPLPGGRADPNSSVH